MDILFYKDQHPFSNFHPAPILYEGKQYSTSEHLFQCMKFIHHPEYMEIIRNSDTPAKCAALARQKKPRYENSWYVNKSLYDDFYVADAIEASLKSGIKIRDDWETVKDDVMLLCITLKFTQNTQLGDYLKSTGNSNLYEDSPTDYYWGIGKERTGKNRLGLLLMHLRDNLLGVINILASKYSSERSSFEYMMQTRELQLALFIFNDNATEHKTCKKGKGNASMRIYNKYSNCNPPKSAGICTGNNRSGYTSLLECKDEIDSNIQEIKELLSTGNYNTLVYSVDNYGNAIIGSGIFTIADEVKEYITTGLLKLCSGGRLYFISEQNGISNYIRI